MPDMRNTIQISKDNNFREDSLKKLDEILENTKTHQDVEKERQDMLLLLNDLLEKVDSLETKLSNKGAAKKAGRPKKED